MSFQRPRIYRVYTHIKFANDAKPNHIIVSFTDLIINYNATSIERLPWKIKIGKDPWYFNNSLSCQPDFSSATKNLLSLPKTQKITTLQQKTGGNTLNLVLKRMLEHVLKILPLKEIIEFQDWKRGYETYTKKNSNQK